MHRNSRTRAFARALACAALVVSALPAGAPAAFAAPTMTFTGRGWGHGVGLSQWGAKGFADHGTLPNGLSATGTNIAAYYYPGSKSSVLATSTDHTILVNLDNAARYSSGGNAGYTRSAWALRAGWSGTSMTLDRGKLSLTYANGPYTFSASGATLIVKDRNGHAVSGSPFSGSINLWPSGGSPPLITVVSASGPFGYANIRYRGGMRLTALGGHVKLVNVLNMQQYLYGVVPRESPSSWPAAALQAQAIVARSYAWTNGGEMYCNTRSQVYEGHSRLTSSGYYLHEATSSNSAVDKTLRVYVVNSAAKTTANTQGVVRTYFFDSSGGHTANIEDVWLGSTASSYYRGVSDPYSMDPYADPWPPVSVSALTVASKFAKSIGGAPSGAGSSVYVKGLSCDRADSGYVRRADIVWSNGTVQKGVSGDSIRSALGFKSTKFYVGGPYTRIAVGDRYATAAAISRSAFATPGAVSCAVLVNGTDAKFADALTASALAGTARGPVLLVTAASLPAASRAELTRLRPKRIYVVGGPASVATAVVSAAISSDPGAVAARLGGADRYAVAAAVASQIAILAPGSGPVMIASGDSWPHAALAAVAAAMKKRPLLLVNHLGVPSATAAALRSLHATHTVVFTGESSVPAGVVHSICAITGESAPQAQLGGVSRYDEAVAGARWCIANAGATISTVYVSSGSAFADAVSGGALAAHNKHPLLLTAPASASSATLAYLTANRSAISNVTVLGGWGSVSDACAGQLGGAAY